MALGVYANVLVRSQRVFLFPVRVLGDYVYVSTTCRSTSPHQCVSVSTRHGEGVDVVASESVCCGLRVCLSERLSGDVPVHQC